MPRRKKPVLDPHTAMGAFLNHAHMCMYLRKQIFLPQPLVLTAVLHSVTNRDSMEAAATLKTSFKVASCGFKISQVMQKHLAKTRP